MNWFKRVTIGSVISLHYRYSGMYMITKPCVVMNNHHAHCRLAKLIHHACDVMFICLSIMCNFMSPWYDVHDVHYDVYIVINVYYKYKMYTFYGVSLIWCNVTWCTVVCYLMCMMMGRQNGQALLVWYENF
jgi:hypothetical protein